MKYSIPIILILLAFSNRLQGQSINPLSDTITWAATGHKNLSTNDTFTGTATFVSYGATKVELVNGEIKRTFTVESVEGAWADANLEGELLFHVDYAGLKGIITLANGQGGLSLTLDMSESSPTGIHNQYFVDHLSVN